MAVAAGTKLVYDFQEGSKDMRKLLGGKGAGVAEMTRILGPDRVPAGFTITTEACTAYMDAGRTEPERLDEQVDDALARLEQTAGKRLGDPSDPLLVSVRSGARESMPGMMDTVLNLGLSDGAVEGLARTTDNQRFAWDSYRRFLQMFGNVCRGVEGEAIERAIAERKRDAGVALDTELEVEHLQGLVHDFKALFRERTREDFPQDPRDQARPGHPRRVRLLDGRARGGVPAHQPHPGRLGDRRERAADGVRKQRGRLVLGRCLLA